MYRDWGRPKIRDIHGFPISVGRSYDCECINIGNYSEPKIGKIINLIV